jgi:hypothetical protein
LFLFSNYLQIGQEDDWKKIIPIKGLYNEMEPNKGGSGAVMRRVRPKVGLLVPSIKVGMDLVNKLAMAIHGKIDLELCVGAEGKKKLISMIEVPDAKGGKKSKDKEEEDEEEEEEEEEDDDEYKGLNRAHCV